MNNRDSAVLFLILLFLTLFKGQTFKISSCYCICWGFDKIPFDRCGQRNGNCSKMRLNIWWSSIFRISIKCYIFCTYFYSVVIIITQFFVVNCFIYKMFDNCKKAHCNVPVLISSGLKLKDTYSILFHKILTFKKLIPDLQVLHFCLKNDYFCTLYSTAVQNRRQNSLNV